MYTAVDNPIAFETPSQLESWLRLRHDRAHELWVRVFKKKSGRATVTVDDCIIAAIAWGWIDGQGRSLDDVSYLVRLTPRRPRSNWSKRNCSYADSLIASGQMQPPGMAHVEAARADGRWDQAYAGSADMVIPDDFIEAIEKCPPAKEQFCMLDRRRLFVIYLSLQTAKRFKTRARRIKRFVDQLAKGQKPS